MIDEFDMGSGTESLDSELHVHLTASRAAGLPNIAGALPAGILLIWIAVSVGTSLRFQASAYSNRLTDYALGFVMMWVLVCGVWLAGRGVRWLAFALWPGSLGVDFTGQRVRVNLGPFGRQELRLQDFRAVYRSELPADEGHSRSTEDFVDPEVEKNVSLPLLIHPRYPAGLNRVLERYTRCSEEQLLERLRPVVAILRPRTAADC